MNVTRATFDTAYDLFQNLLHSPQCRFVSLDEEMTGISIAEPGQQECLADLTTQRYEKMRRVASKYRIIQIGLCLWLENKSESGPSPPQYSCAPFNIYLFPSTGTIEMDAAGIAFNSQNGMNFNTWIRDGVDYCNAEKEREVRERLEGEGGTKQVQLLKMEHKDFVDSEMVRFRTFMQKSADECPQFRFLGCNAILCIALRQRVENEFKDIQNTLLITEAKYSNSFKRELVVSRMSVEQRDKILQDQKEAKLRSALGFRLFFSELVKFQRPLISHNGFYDLLFMYSHFESSLPLNLNEFKDRFHNLFPRVFDTKWLVQQLPLSKLADGSSRFVDTSLSQVYNTLRKEELEEISLRPQTRKTFEFLAGEHFVRYKIAETAVPDSVEADSAASFLHEAAYDAFITGYTFARLDRERPLLNMDRNESTMLCNIVPVYKSLFAMNLARSFEDAPLYPHELPVLLVLYDFTEEVPVSELHVLLSHATKNLMGEVSDPPYHIYWSTNGLPGSTTALVPFTRPDLEPVLKHFVRDFSTSQAEKRFKIVMWKQYEEMQRENASRNH